MLKAMVWFYIPFFSFFKKKKEVEVELIWPVQQEEHFMFV